MSQFFSSGEEDDAGERSGEETKPRVPVKKRQQRKTVQRREDTDFHDFASYLQNDQHSHKV